MSFCKLRRVLEFSYFVSSKLRGVPVSVTSSRQPHATTLIMKTAILTTLFFAIVGCKTLESPHQTELIDNQNAQLTTFPANKATNVNPDTYLVLTFSSPPKIGNSGTIKIYDAADKELIDNLDMKVPSSPNPSGRAPGNKGTTTAPPPADPKDKTPYQVNMIGGYDFHFFPIIVHGNVATINLHNGALKYGKTYIIKMDPSILSGFEGFTTDSSWTFSTKAAPPTTDSNRVIVASDGTGDFNTLQGAIDWTPASPPKKITILIQNGLYEEIIFLSKKSNLIIRGESREGVKVGYPNNSAFNPAKAGPSRRPAFTINDCKDIQLSSFTVENYFIGQAEAMLVRGQRIILDHMTLNGSGDAFTTYGTIYFVDSKLTGHGDTVLGYGAVFFLRSEIQSIGPMTWTRTVSGSHGNIFVNSTLIGIDKPLPWTVTDTNPRGQIPKAVFARLPGNGPNKDQNFPNAEMVLINTKTSGTPPEGWGPVQQEGFDKKNVHFWEFNTMDAEGRLVDTSRRAGIGKVLTLPKDAKTIEDYQRPEFVLDGWRPIIVNE
jgi:pectinesterase